MEFTIDYTLKDYSEIQKAHYGSSVFRKAISVLGIFSLLFGIYLMLAGIFDISTLFIIAGGFIFLFFEKIVLEPRNNNEFKKSKYLQDPFKYKLDREGIRSTNKYLDTKSTWDSFISMKITNKVVLLYRGPNMITGFPKHYFREEEWKKLIEFLKENIKKCGI